MNDFGPAIAQTIDDFKLFDDWEDRYKYVIDLGRELAPLSAEERNERNKVRGCASQVWLIAEPRDAGGERRIVFRGDSDASIVKGLIAILFKLYSGATREEILTRDAQALFQTLGLAEHLSQQRANGFFSMVERIKAIAAG
jgi:cysteine desulfuration protein SufE